VDKHGMETTNTRKFDSLVSPAFKLQLERRNNRRIGDFEFPHALCGCFEDIRKLDTNKDFLEKNVI